MNKIVKKRFDLDVNAADAVISKTFELDKTITAIKGLLLTCDRDDLLYFRGSQRIEINKEEIFPEGYESKLLLSGINVPPRSRFYDLGSVPAGNGNVKIDYTDTPHVRTIFVPYRVSLYLECEIID